MKFPQTEGNNVELILDGLNFFQRLQDLFDEVRESDPSPNTYLRLAFWEIDKELKLPNGKKITTCLKEIADAGHPVDIITWCPAKLDIYFDKNLSANIKNTNDAFAKQVRGYNSDGVQTGYIRVLQEIYNGWNGSSTHQKLVISSVSGQLKTLVGGMNLASFYYDDDTHTGQYQGGMGQAPLDSTIHDTAVQIKGSAAVDIETEWLRRYYKRFAKTQLSSNSGSLTDNAKTSQKFKDLAKAVKDKQINEKNGQSVTICTTNSESYFGRGTHIQEELVKLIRQAKDYIYLEGFVISDPTIITELCARVTKVQKLKIVIIVPQPYKENPFPFDYLNYISFCKLALSTCEAVKVKGEWIERANCTKWSIGESYNYWSSIRSIMSVIKNRWLENDCISLTTKANKSISVPLLEIQDFRGGISFYAPWRNYNGKESGIYIHSKLALIDDKVAVIGSANFSYRSQVYDGELSAFIKGALVRHIRYDLLKHWGLRGGVEQFFDDIDSPPKKTAWLEKLECRHYPKIPPVKIDVSYGKINHTFI